MEEKPENWKEGLWAAGFFLFLGGACFFLHFYQSLKPLGRRIQYITAFLLFIGKWGAIIFIGMAIISSAVALVIYLSDKKKQ